MTLKQLQAFYWAAKLDSFSIAADRLFISQSSLSKRIAELEYSLDKELFDRSARRAVLTREGEMALTSVKLILDTESELRGKLKPGSDLRGNLRIGIGELTAATWFPRFVARIAIEHPGLLVDPQVGQGRSMEVDVERGILDCAVIAGLPTRPSIVSQQLPSVEFSWMGSPRLAVTGRTITPSLLRDYPVLTFAAPSGQAQLFNDWLTTNGAQVDRVSSCNSIHTIVELAIAGLGLCLLPRQHLQPVLARKLLVEYKCVPAFPALNYRLIWRHDDSRGLIQTVRSLVMKEVNFDLTTPLWGG